MVLQNPRLRHEDTEGDPKAGQIVGLNSDPQRNLEACNKKGLNVAGFEAEVQRKYYKRRPTTRKEKLAQLIRDGINTSTLWYTIGAKPMNCDIVLDAIIAR